jgi:hypothetical protein
MSCSEYTQGIDGEFCCCSCKPGSCKSVGRFSVIEAAADVDGRATLVGIFRSDVWVVRSVAFVVLLSRRDLFASRSDVDGDKTSLSGRFLLGVGVVSHDRALAREDNFSLWRASELAGGFRECMGLVGSMGAWEEEISGRMENNNARGLGDTNGLS